MEEKFLHVEICLIMINDKMCWKSDKSVQWSRRQARFEYIGSRFWKHNFHLFTFFWETEVLPLSIMREKLLIANHIYEVAIIWVPNGDIIKGIKVILFRSRVN